MPLNKETKHTIAQQAGQNDTEGRGVDIRSLPLVCHWINFGNTIDVPKAGNVLLVYPVPTLLNQTGYKLRSNVTLSIT